MKTAAATRFVRRTQLAPGEYRKNFQQKDREIIEAVTSAEADRVTPLMSKIYLRLANAPSRFFERDGVLRFEAEERDGQLRKAWLVLCEVLRVSSATANKALSWLHEQGIIGYFAGKNGVGIRIFLNRASSSIGKKILPFRAASPDACPASHGETAFIDSFAVLENSEINDSRRAPQRGGRSNDQAGTPSTTVSDPRSLRPQLDTRPANTMLENETARTQPPRSPDVAETTVIAKEIVTQQLARERESMRDWLENRGLPKVARVVQREVLDTLKRNGLLKDVKPTRLHTESAQKEGPNRTPRRLSAAEINELAAVCVSMLEVQGRPIEQTVSGMSVERGGFVSEQDLAKIDRAARDIIAATPQEGRRLPDV